jgi:hypothetical protein
VLHHARRLAARGNPTSRRLGLLRPRAQAACVREGTDRGSSHARVLATLEHRRHAWDVLGRPEVCGEPGFECAGCLSERDCEILGVKSIEWKGRQRAACGCLAQKVELLNRRGPCR